MEVALAVPFDSNEVKKILCEEFRKRLDGLSPLQGGKEYGAFKADFQVKIWVRRIGESGAGKETLAWGHVAMVNGTAIIPGSELVEETATIDDEFASQEPNVEREERDMPLTVETGDGRGGKITKKVHVRR